MMLVRLQLLLCQREHLFAHQCRHRDLNPLRARPLMTTNVAARKGLSLTQRARDALPGPLFGFAIAGSPAIRGIAQHAPNGGSLPAALAGPCCNLTLIQQTCDGIDAEA